MRTGFTKNIMIITEEAYYRQIAAVDKQDHWRNAGKRWGYHKHTADILRQIQPVDVLEAGIVGVRVFAGSDTIDYDKVDYWRIRERPTYYHDMSKVPYPVSKRYDVFVALRVLHRIGDVDMREVFGEMRRIADHVIIGVPKSWSWKRFGDTEPRIIPSTHKTVIYWYDNSDTPVRG